MATKTKRRYTKTGKCSAWGSDRYARRLAHLTKSEREFVRSGGELYLADAPEHCGCTDRLIVEIGGRFYCRMP